MRVDGLVAPQIKQARFSHDHKGIVPLGRRFYRRLFFKEMASRPRRFYRRLFFELSFAEMDGIDVFSFPDKP